MRSQGIRLMNYSRLDEGISQLFRLLLELPGFIALGQVRVKGLCAEAVVKGMTEIKEIIPFSGAC